MGRKIPAKKHHGAKDPEKQAERRYAKIKMKINQAPENIEEQEIPKKLKHLFKQKTKKIEKHIEDRPVKNKAKNKGSEIDQHIPQRPLKKIPNFKRLPDETDRDYLWRVELLSRAHLKKARFEDKYDVDLEIDKLTGDVEVKKKEKLLIDTAIQGEPQTKQEKRKLKKQLKLQKEREERKKLKMEKFKAWKLHKKNKGKKNDDFSVLKQEKVEFGDVAPQPPSLTAKPRKSNNTEKPGNRALLLKNLLPGEKPSERSGKRKDLSALDRHNLEEERLRVVNLYREMQKQKHAKNTLDS